MNLYKAIEKSLLDYNKNDYQGLKHGLWKIEFTNFETCEICRYERSLWKIWGDNYTNCEIGNYEHGKKQGIFLYYYNGSYKASELIYYRHGVAQPINNVDMNGKQHGFWGKVDKSNNNYIIESYIHGDLQQKRVYDEYLALIEVSSYIDGKLDTSCSYPSVTKMEIEKKLTNIRQEYYENVGVYLKPFKSCSGLDTFSIKRKKYPIINW